MNGLDLAVLAVVGLSALIGLWRGFVREVLSVLIWIVALWVGVRFSGDLAVHLEPWIDSPTIRLGAAFVGLFIGALVAGALVNNLLVKLVTSTGLGGTDRLLGGVFGAARGGVVVALVILMLGFTPATQERFWDDSVLLPSIKPWICHAGIDAWLSEWEGRPPLLEGEAMDGVEGLPEYWIDYCAARRD